MGSHEKLHLHYVNVKKVHDNLDKEIEDSYNHYTNDQELKEMKQRKLKLREEMARIEDQLGIEHGKSLHKR